MSELSSLNSLCCTLHLRLWVLPIMVQDDSFALLLLVSLRGGGGERCESGGYYEGELERREEVYLKAVFLEVSPLCTRCFGACCSILLILG
jgi:hypothetical protein